jgi:nitrate reductase NapE component
MGKGQSRRGEHLYFFFICIIIAPILMCGCSHVYEGFVSRPELSRARQYNRMLS